MLKTSLCLLSVAVSACAIADENSKNKYSADQLEHVIVSGSRIFESIDEVPASITVINQQQIQQHLKVNPELSSLLAQMVPGLAPSTGSSVTQAKHCVVAHL